MTIHLITESYLLRIFANMHITELTNFQLVEELADPQIPVYRADGVFFKSRFVELMVIASTPGLSGCFKLSSTSCLTYSGREPIHRPSHWPVTAESRFTGHYIGLPQQKADLQANSYWPPTAES